MNEVILENHLEKFLPLAQLRHYVDELALFEDLVDLYDVGVILGNKTDTKDFIREISLMVLVLILGNLRVLIFLMALAFPVFSWVARKTSP